MTKIWYASLQLFAIHGCLTTNSKILEIQPILTNWYKNITGKSVIFSGILNGVNFFPKINNDKPFDSSDNNEAVEHDVEKVEDENVSNANESNLRARKIQVNKNSNSSK